MCDAVTEQLIRSAVDGFVQKGYMFTAFDVTKFLRKSGERIRHSDVNDVVKAMYANTQMGQYARDTKDVGAPIAPFVYYHPYSDLNNYDQHWVDNNPSQTGMKNDSQDDGTSTQSAQSTQSAPAVPGGCHAGIPNAAPASMTSATVPKDAHAVTSSEGRLQIPINVVRCAGFQPNQVASLVLDGNKLIVRSTAPGMFNSVKVNKDGRIRINRIALSRVSNGTLFKVERQGSEIVVQPY